MQVEIIAIIVYTPIPLLYPSLPYPYFCVFDLVVDYGWCVCMESEKEVEKELKYWKSNIEILFDFFYNMLDFFYSLPLSTPILTIIL